MSNEHYLRVRNFERFQRFNRENLKQQPNPHWIKLYHALLADRMFYRLPDATKFHVVGIFLIASQHDNKIPCDLDWIRHQIGATERIDLKALLESRFIEWVEPSGPATTELSEILQNASDEVSPLNYRKSNIGDNQRREENKKHLAKRTSPNYTADFEAFWDQSSKRGSKWEAYLEWQKISEPNRKTATAAMLQAIRTEWANREPQYIPHVVKWLKGRRWENVPVAKAAKLPL